MHPGGPFWKNKDDGAWTIPKGLIDPGEAPLDAARREFAEETGLAVPEGPFLALTPLRQPSGKLVMAWAAEGDCDPATVCSNLFRMEWPPRSGKFDEFPEVDRAGWFPIPAAEAKIIKGQRGFLAELQRLLR